MALNELDKKLSPYIDCEYGFFVEAGANDGISQSNTIRLEKEKNWRGLLVEPNPHKYKECVINRPNSIVENYALVNDAYDKDTIQGDFNHQDVNNSLMALVSDLGDFCDESLLYYKEQRKRDCEIIDVPAISLNKLFKKHDITDIDFFSLDVEGYEITVLNGLDLNIYRPIYFLIETTTLENRRKIITDYMLNKNYELIGEMSCNDLLFRDKYA